MDLDLFTAVAGGQGSLGSGTICLPLAPEHQPTRLFA